VVGITSPPSGFLDQHGRPGHSATGEYRRRRAADWQTWKPTITLRIAAVLTASVSVGLLTAAVATSSLAWFTGLIAAAALAWRLRFRPTAETLAWRRGAHGERRTARLLAPWSGTATRSSTTSPSPGRPPTLTTSSSAPQGCL
jgi:hypothetical protein